MEDARMKVRFFVGLSAVLLAITALAFSARTYRATAQGSLEYKLPAAVGTEPVPPIQQHVCPSPVPLPAQQPSLSEMIANLKELRMQEQQLAKSIKEKINTQKKSLDDAEKELNSLGIEATPPIAPPIVPTPLISPPLPTQPIDPLAPITPSGPSAPH
jgi:hypothetical protein